MYPNLFKSRYPCLKGRDWIRSVEPEDRYAFARIGLEASDYGRSGGNALVEKKGKKYMKQIARRGATMTNILKEWRRQVQFETWNLQQNGGAL